MTFTRLTFPALEFDPPDELAAHQQIESTFMQRAHMYTHTHTCILTTAHMPASPTRTQILCFEEDIHINFIGVPCLLLKCLQTVICNLPFKLYLHVFKEIIIQILSRRFPSWTVSLCTFNITPRGPSYDLSASPGHFGLCSTYS